VTSLLRRTRLAALAAARSAGAFRLAADSAWRQRRLLVLCWHGVSVRDEHEWSTLYVSQAHLERRLQRLRELRCTVLPLGEALARQAANELPPRSVAITFDDGAADFFTRAYPVLQAFAMPATLYQTTWYVDKPYPVFNTAASYVMWQARGRDVLLPWRTAAIRMPTDAQHPHFVALHTELRQHVAHEQLDAAAQHALLEELAARCGACLAPLHDQRLLFVQSSEQLRALDPSLVDVQLHSHRHRAPAERTLFVRELDDNANALRHILQRPLGLTHYCYPSNEYRPEHFAWLHEWGIESAATCNPGLLDARTDRLLLPRLVDTMFTPDAVFDGWVSGAAALLPVRREERLVHVDSGAQPIITQHTQLVSVQSPPLPPQVS
jgi:peptidoglycan/xylan/chitin deacetylase (PgdA/CDA1 family)